MKTINVSDELHTRLKNAADFCGISIQTLVTQMLERDFENAITVKEITIDDTNDLKLYHDQIQSYLRIKNLNEGQFKVTLTQDLFKLTKIKIYHQ
jgi:hypothetical protein